MSKLMLLLVLLFLASCASGRAVNRDSEDVNDTMITFVQRAQAGFWKEAMANITPEEREDMMDGSQVLPEYKEAIGRIRLSTIRNMELGLDNKGRLVGVRDLLDGSNNMYRASEEKIVIDPKKLEDLAARRQKEEEAARKRLEESPPVEGPSEWDIYYGKPEGRSKSKPESELENESEE